MKKISKEIKAFILTALCGLAYLTIISIPTTVWLNTVNDYKLKMALSIYAIFILFGVTAFLIGLTYSKFEKLFKIQNG